VFDFPQRCIDSSQCPRNGQLGLFQGRLLFPRRVAFFFFLNVLLLFEKSGVFQAGRRDFFPSAPGGLLFFFCAPPPPTVNLVFPPCLLFQPWSEVQKIPLFALAVGAGYLPATNASFSVLRRRALSLSRPFPFAGNEFLSSLPSPARRGLFFPERRPCLFLFRLSYSRKPPHAHHQKWFFSEDDDSRHASHFPPTIQSQRPFLQRCCALSRRAFFPTFSLFAANPPCNPSPYPEPLSWSTVWAKPPN